jgi:hypothetical protein
MQAIASFRGAQVSSGLVRLFIAAVLVAFFLGGTGGYLVRGLGSSVSTPTSGEAHHPFVIESPPYSTAAPQPTPDPITDPSGHVVPI